MNSVSLHHYFSEREMKGSEWNESFGTFQSFSKEI